MPGAEAAQPQGRGTRRSSDARSEPSAEGAPALTDMALITAVRAHASGVELCPCKKIYIYPNS